MGWLFSATWVWLLVTIILAIAYFRPKRARRPVYDWSEEDGWPRE